MTEAEFAGEFMALAVVFNEDTEAESFDVKRELYWRVFQDWPIACFQTACARWITTARFFPKPAELLDLRRALARDAQPVRVALPRQDETPEDAAAREEAMAAMRKFLDAGPPTTRFN